MLLRRRCRTYNMDRVFQLREQKIRRHRLVLAICFLSVLFFLCIIVALLLKYALGLDASRNDLADGLRLDGSWGDWLPWSQCSATCGGGFQSRKRFCDDPDPQNNGSYCDGVYDENRRCASWPCPDCSKSCTKGSLRQCVYCECMGTDLRGRVSDMDSMPLYGVRVYIRNMQWEPLLYTSSLGHFSVSNFCKEELVLVFRKEGYRTAMVNATSLPDSGGYMSISLEKLRQPKLTRYPLDSVAFVGDQLTLSCMSDFPRGSKYEWYKNSNILSHPNERPGMTSLSTANAPILIISNSQKEDSGFYRCRTINDLGEKTFSVKAFVNIVGLENEDTCNPNPLTKFLTLPVGCTTPDGSNWVNGGYCPSTVCKRQISTPDRDQQAERRCCGIIQTETINIQCQQWSFTIAKAKRCGCIIECGKTYKIPVTGQTILKDPLFETTKYIKTTLKHEGEVLTTDKDGKLMISVYSNDTRTILTIPRSTYPNAITPDVQVRLISPGFTSHFDILLKNQASPVRIQSSQTMEFPVMSVGMTSPPEVSVTLPGNQVMNGSWSSYNGTMDVYTAFLDSRLKSNMESAPGDYTYRNEEGEIYQLLIYGILIIYIEDPDGNSISMNADIVVNIKTSELNIPRRHLDFWTLDPITARWRICNSRIVHQEPSQNGGITPLRVNIEINPETKFIALAKSLPNRERCEVKLAVYQNENRTEPLPGQLVKIISKQKGNFVHKNEAVTGLYGSVCVQVPCGCEHHLSVVNHHPSQTQAIHLPTQLEYTVSEDNVWLIFTSPQASEITSKEGPIHRHGGHTCYTGRDHNTTYQFEFVKSLVPLNHRGVLNINENRHGFNNSWFEHAMDSPHISACAVKLTLKGASNITEVIAVSRKDGPTTEVYGTHITMPSDPMLDGRSPGQQVSEVCVLVRCPSPGVREDIDTVHVDIHFILPTSTECHITNRISSPGVNWIGSEQTSNHTLSFLLTEDINANTIGIYRSSGHGSATSDWTMFECSKSSHSALTLDCG